jgi:hypothetical protein
MDAKSVTVITGASQGIGRPTRQLQTLRLPREQLLVRER